MALLLWTDHYDLGYAAIDAQHRELADYVNALAAAEETAAVQQAFDQLILFTAEHFEYEQTLFLQTGYPAADIHIKRHGFLILILKRFRQTIVKRGPTAAELAFLRGWLLDHIDKEDRAFVVYARSHNPALFV
jgi:hemerythrin